MQIKENFKHSNSYDLPKATVKEASSIIKSLNPKKARLCPYKSKQNCFKGR